MAAAAHAPTAGETFSGTAPAPPATNGRRVFVETYTMAMNKILFLLAFLLAALVAYNVEMVVVERAAHLWCFLLGYVLYSLLVVGLKPKGREEGAAAATATGKFYLWKLHCLVALGNATVGSMGTMFTSYIYGKERASYIALWAIWGCSLIAVIVHFLLAAAAAAFQRRNAAAFQRRNAAA